MSCKTIGRFVYDSATVTAVDAGGNIPFASTTATPDVLCDGETITITKGGVYYVEFNATFVATATGELETQLYRNGNAVPGAHAYSTAVADGDYVAQAYATVITVPKCGQTAVNVRAIDATEVTVANLIITKAV